MEANWDEKYPTWILGISNSPKDFTNIDKILLIIVRHE